MEAIRIRTDQAESGMVVATDVYTPNNQLIIPKGTKLDERMITRLRFYNIYGLFVYKSDSETEEQKDESYIEMLRSTVEFKKFNRTYVETVNNVEDSFNQVINGSSEFDVDTLLADTDRILREGRNGAHIFEMLHGIRDYDDLTFVHSLNVSLICSIFAGWLKLSKEDSRVLAMAGLLHDIGKMLVPKEIITKADKLSGDEYEIIKTHSIKGYQVLKDQPIDIRVKYAALMHHERCDGSGYPNGFKANQIEEFSKIIAIADVYDAMTSNRRYRKAICPFDVVENFERDGFLKYDPGYLMVFMERIVNSYMHNIVRLSDGREGEVIMINKLALSRPVIRVGSKFVDLSKEHSLSIDAII
ncbi:HD-GYP domain-containing protein [Mobilitalea sibirica]|uniref:HD-GYP domain-containing protein n=1 Tax=Mobilitalea sibirica TaxID=1462919 RepID=A0A8J7H0F9_9FIRM|nr:HD-GYP domain-containing protein [Mobilitalea sibirica]MBH1941874.1 HD-GYP domain-containing protein [Mobilitalea sibirica]